MTLSTREKIGFFGTLLGLLSLGLGTGEIIHVIFDTVHSWIGVPPSAVMAVAGVGLLVSASLHISINSDNYFNSDSS